MSRRLRATTTMSLGLSLAVTALVAVATLAACGGASSGTSPTTTPTPAATLKPLSTAVPTVYLLGGSAARESIVSCSSWAAAVKKAGGGTINARDFGATNQTYDADLQLVKAMPAGKALVFIGLAVGRYTEVPGTGPATDPQAIVNSNADVVHRYSTPLSLGRKKQLVNQWVTTRYPEFKKNFAANAAGLDTLIQGCIERHFHPVLLELPLNLEVVGSSFDPARAQYGADAKKLAAQYKIPYVDFVAEAKLTSTEFFDLFHLIAPGRDKWQPLLTRETVKVLQQDDLTAK